MPSVKVMSATKEPKKRWSKVVELLRLRDAGRLGIGEQDGKKPHSHRLSAKTALVNMQKAGLSSKTFPSVIVI